MVVRPNLVEDALGSLLRMRFRVGVPAIQVHELADAGARVQKLALDTAQHQVRPYVDQQGERPAVDCVDSLHVEVERLPLRQTRDVPAELRPQRSCVRQGQRAGDLEV